MTFSESGVDISGRESKSLKLCLGAELPEVVLMTPLAKFFASSRESIQLNVRSAMTKSLPSLSNVRSM